jgi:hypothetical protein
VGSQAAKRRRRHQAQRHPGGHGRHHDAGAPLDAKPRRQRRPHTSGQRHADKHESVAGQIHPNDGFAYRSTQTERGEAAQQHADIGRRQLGQMASEFGRQ